MVNWLLSRVHLESAFSSPYSPGRASYKSSRRLCPRYATVCEGELNRTSLIRVGQHPAGRTCYQSAPKSVLGSQMSLLKFIDLAKSFMFCPLSSRSRLQVHTPWFSYAHHMQIPIGRAIVVLASDGYRLCCGLRHYSLRLPHLHSHEEEEELSDNI